ncbi:uncharacterized protein LOC101967141 isoform X2 [Ictidomys tridecemlineatus]
MHSGPALVNKWLCDLGWGILLSVNPALICPPPLSYPPRITKNLSEVGPLLLATLVSLALQQHSWVQLDVSISNLPETWRLARPWNTLSAMELDGQDCSSWAQLDSWPAGLPAAPHLLPRGKFLTRWTTPALEDLPSSLGRAEARQRPDSKATIPALCVPGAPRGRGPCCRRLAAPPQHSGAWSRLQGQSSSQTRRKRRSPRGVRDSCSAGCTLQLPGQRPLPTRPQPSPASCSGCWEALSPHMREHALRHTRPSQAPLRGPAAAGGCTECCQVLRSTASPHPRPLLLSCLEV